MWIHEKGRLWAEFDNKPTHGGVTKATSGKFGIKIPLNDTDYVVVDRASLAKFELRNESMDEETLAKLPKLVQQHIHQLQKIETADSSEIRVGDVRSFVTLMKEAHIPVPREVKKFLLEKTKDDSKPPEAIVAKLKKVIRKFSGKKVIVATVDVGAGAQESSSESTAVVTEPSLFEAAPTSTLSETNPIILPEEPKPEKPPSIPPPSEIEEPPKTPDALHPSLNQEPPPEKDK